jgi:tetratricopeptide (TPR) repeat protein
MSVRPREANPSMPRRRARSSTHWVLTWPALVGLLLLPGRCGALDAAAVAAPAAGSETVLGCGATEFALIALPPSPEAVVIRLDDIPAGGAMIEIEEMGQDVRIAAGFSGEIRSIDAPPRLGVFFLRAQAALTVRVERLREGAAKGMVGARLHCASDRQDTRWAWIGAAHVLGSRLGGGVGAIAGDETDRMVSALEAQAHDARTRAWALHLRAQALLLQGRSADAGPAFLEAATAWQELGDAARAAAARAGAAEDFNRSGEYARSLELARAADASADPAHYYGIRLENARCLALHYLGRLVEAVDCYAWTSAALETLGETLELAGTALNFAAIERSLGRLDAARRLSLQALELAGGTQARVVEGRAHYTLADLALRSGDQREATTRLRLAQERFAAAGEVRWEASSLLSLGRLLADLRAFGDARRAADRALGLFDARHAPARLAGVRLLLARLDLAEGRIAEGIVHAAAAAEIFRGLEMPEEAALADFELARLLIGAGKADAAADALARAAAGEAILGGRLRLARAELALAKGDAAAALPILQDLGALPLPLDDQIRLARARARTDRLQGRSEASRDHLLALAQAIARASRSSRQYALAHALERALLALQPAAIEQVADALAEGASAAHVLAQVSPWLALAAASPPDDDRPAPSPAVARLDRALAAAMLTATADQEPEADGDWAAMLELLDSDRSHASSEAPAPATDARIHRSLSGDPTLLLFEGETRLLSILVHPPEAPIATLAPLATIRATLDELNAATREPASGTREIDARARALSAHLLGGLQGLARPARLRVLGGGLADAVPWPLMYWPGEAEDPLAEIPITLVQPWAGGPVAEAPGHPGIRVLQAMQARSATALPRLYGAPIEPGLIAASVPTRSVMTAPGASREALIEAFAAQGAWVHVSAHGTLQPGLVAGSGLWLDPGDGHHLPEYVSPLDFLGRRLGARLVVLNACQLAAADAGVIDASMDFATAISRAGVAHVVAARWAVSDSAGNVWVPAFYRALAVSSPPDPAQALAEARRALRASRHFRHPFHWAGWVHLEHLPFVE